MAKRWVIENCYCCYIGNQPYIYPNDDLGYSGSVLGQTYNTGYHVVPNILWSHYCTPKQWADLIINNQAIHVEGYEIDIFNPIPMTTQLAIQGTNAFTSFNNTIYGWAYQDKEYETPWENWYHSLNQDHTPNLLYKEGLQCKFNGTQKYRFSWPIYAYESPRRRFATKNTPGNARQNSNQSVFYVEGNPTGLIWDPLNDPSNVQEIRPGKNSIRFTWNCHPCDKDKWFNLDAVGSWHPYRTTGPYQGINRPHTYELTKSDDPDILTSQYEDTLDYNDYTWPEWEDQPIVPMGNVWKEMQQSIIQDQTPLKPDLFFPGTEYEQYTYGPTQCFIKMAPLFDENGHHIPIYTMISVRMRLILDVKPRKSAIYAPTWGPFNGKMLYSAKGLDRSFRLSVIRARTGGHRRAWQNQQRATNPATSDGVVNVNQGHGREDPYQYPQTQGAIVTSGSGAGGTRSTYTLAGTKRPVNYRVTFNKDLDRVVMTPSIQSRSTISRGSHSPNRDDDLMI